MPVGAPCLLCGLDEHAKLHLADAVYDNRLKLGAGALAAGAEIIVGLEETPYGSKEYAARDPEGHVWSFGSYAPDLE